MTYYDIHKVGRFGITPFVGSITNSQTDNISQFSHLFNYTIGYTFIQINKYVET